MIYGKGDQMQEDHSKYITVIREDTEYYGGNQNLFPEKKLKGFGCGLIAATDVIMYLMDCPNTFQWDQYYESVKKIEKYFFYLPFFGMSGMALSLGINRVFHHYRLPYRAWWRLLPMRESSKAKIKKMLEDHLPVIISIGPNFPNVFGKKSVPLYRKAGTGLYHVCGSVHNHYVVITEFTGEDKMKVSSWGKTYYIDWKEYLDYSRKKSFPVFTNYLDIRGPVKNISEETNN